MASITTINGSDLITNSRAVINTNFTNLNTDKIETSYLDTDTSLTTNSDVRIPTQKAVKAYVDATANPTGASWNAYAVDSVGTDSYAITVSTMTTYTSGQTFKFKAGTANTGACTLNINGLGAKTIKKAGSLDLDTGDIVANQIVEVTYDGTNMQMVSPNNVRKFSTGIASKNVADASTTQNIAHGLGIAPSKVRFSMVVATGGADRIFTMNGVYTASGSACQSVITKMSNTETSAATSSTLYSIIIVPVAGSPSDLQSGVVTVDATNIVITWTKSGTPTGTYSFMWEAEY